MVLEIGMSAEQSYVVSEKDLATNYGGEALVLSSPALIGLLERTCMLATDEELPAEDMTVGMGFDIMHLAPTPPGETVILETTLNEIQKNQLMYFVSAHDSKGLISTGTHIRAIVNRDRFFRKLLRRNNAAA